MTDVAGLVIGVAALWKSAVAGYDLIDHTRSFGVDAEILAVKLEVERVRLLNWGEAVGLNSLLVSGTSSDPSTSNQSPDNQPDARFNRQEVRTAVQRVLGCIQHVFEDTKRLEERYGLQPTGGLPDSLDGSEDMAIPPSQTQRMIQGVFKRAYDTMQWVAKDRQKTTSITRKTAWAIRDRSKFLYLISELRAFNDSLFSLFPDSGLQVAMAMRGDIDDSMEVRGLTLLEEATSGEDRALSEYAGMRLDELGVTRSARTELLTVTRDAESDADTIDVPWNGRKTPDEGERAVVLAYRPKDDKDEPDEPDLTELEKKFEELERFVGKKSQGALIASVYGPYAGAYISAEARWDGEERSTLFASWERGERGFVDTAHASFELYKKKQKFLKSRRYDDGSESKSSEDYLLMEAECHAKLEHVNPGTVTVEGFGVECWDFEDSKPREHTVTVSYADIPAVRAPRLLRRMDEIRRSPKLSWNTQQNLLNLKEFAGDGVSAADPRLLFIDMFSILNRTDIFVNFLSVSSIGGQMLGSPGEDIVGIWNFIYQMILGWELAERLKVLDQDVAFGGYTERVLATLIVSELWFKNVEIILVDEKISKEKLKKPETDTEWRKAEEHNEKGKKAMKWFQYDKAVDSFTEAIALDQANATYRCNKAEALLRVKKLIDAEEEAWIATQLGHRSAQAWFVLATTCLQQGDAKRAKPAYQKAIQLAGKDTSRAMRKGLEEAEEAIEKAIRAINEEKNNEKAHQLRSAFLDQDWDIRGKSVELHSCIHEQQVEGLILFAERMKWPFINEVRDTAEEAYGLIRGGGTIPVHLYDWLFGLTLPGRWFAFKIMAALVACSPSIKDKLHYAHTYDSGLSLSTRSYWRVRTVLGRVLGCLPGVISLCGWIGPCPPVQFDPPLPEQPRYIKLKTRRVSPREHRSDVNIVYNTGFRWEATRIQPHEEIEPYLAEIKDSSNWIILEPPVRDISTCSIETIKLSKLPLRTDLARRAASASPDDVNEMIWLENEAEYRASIVFRLDNNAPEPITYKLYTNPVFVTLPPCHPGPKGNNHEVHMREMKEYQNIWSIERLKGHTPEADLDENDGEARVLIINATGKGAEVLARAWCSERGRNAVIRKAGGPCFACAVRAASPNGLGTGVLIWTG